MYKTLTLLLLLLNLNTISSLSAKDYKIDTEGGHASINFQILHLGYSWLTGRFNHFNGKFSYDKNNESQSKIQLTIDVESLDSNHAERDKHLRGKKFLHTQKFPNAKFVSQSFRPTSDHQYELRGDLTLRGVTKSITIMVRKNNEGDDPWGGYRVGFEGTTRFALADYGIDYDLGLASTHVDMSLHIEGVAR